jgi:hypothetical protein
MYHVSGYTGGNFINEDDLALFYYLLGLKYNPPIYLGHHQGVVNNENQARSGESMLDIEVS